MKWHWPKSCFDKGIVRCNCLITNETKPTSNCLPNSKNPLYLHGSYCCFKVVLRQWILEAHWCNMPFLVYDMGRRLWANSYFAICGFAQSLLYKRLVDFGQNICDVKMYWKRKVLLGYFICGICALFILCWNVPVFKGHFTKSEIFTLNILHNSQEGFLPLPVIKN